MTTDNIFKSLTKRNPFGFDDSNVDENTLEIGEDDTG
jgi:hypothetical protein